MAVTSVARTAFDLPRRGPAGGAIERLDALGAATNLDVDDVLAVAEHQPHIKGLRRVGRLLLIEAGFRRRKPRYRYSRCFLDMGWRDVMVAVDTTVSSIASIGIPRPRRLAPHQGDRR